MTSATNPFFAGTYLGRAMYALAADDRLRRVAEFDKSQCEAALLVPGLQKTVRTAIERRLRALAKQGG